MSRKETKTGLSGAEIAAELRALADDLAEGRLRIGVQHVRVGEPFSLKTKQKLNGNKAYFTMSVKMPLSYGTSKDTDLPPSSAGAKPEIVEPPRLQGESGYSGKRLKKEIGRLWESVAKLIEAETMPDATGTEGLLKRCEEYDLFADDDWQAEWATCTKLVQKCLTDAAIGDWPAARAMVREINRMTRNCHRQYKKR
jgi:XXXCH domain-containing protein